MIDHDRNSGIQAIRARCVLPAACKIHGGTPGFTNLVVTKHNSGAIMFDPHATGSCVFTLDQDAATALRDMLTVWLA
jgi:hypothetical protein